MIRLLRIEIDTADDYSERELAILHTLLLTIMSASMRSYAGIMKPIPESKANLSMQYVFKQQVEQGDGEELLERIERLVKNGFRMSELTEPVVKITTE